MIVEDNLTKDELENLSDLLVNTNTDNIEIGLGILTLYPQCVQDVTKELVLLAKLGEDEEQKKLALSLLEATFVKKQIEDWEIDFYIFELRYELYSYEKLVTNWCFFEAHENVRLNYMPLIKKNPNYASRYYSLAANIVGFYAPKIDLAEIYYRISLEGNPTNIRLWLNLANLYRGPLARFEKALECYDKVLLINPKEYASLRLKANFYLDYKVPKDPKKAIELLQEALRYYPKDYHLEADLADAMAYLEESEWKEKGIDSLKQMTVENLEEDLAWAHYAKHLWITFRDVKEAIKIYEKGIAYNPKSYLLNGNLAKLYEQEYQDYRLASKYYHQSCLVRHYHTFPLINYIPLLVINLKHYKKAKKLYIELKKMAYQYIKPNPEVTPKEWNKFLEAQNILWERYPTLKEFK